MRSDVFSSPAGAESAPTFASARRPSGVSPSSPFVSAAESARGLAFASDASFIAGGTAGRASSALVRAFAERVFAASAPSSPSRPASCRAAALASSGALRMACENFAAVLMKAMISARLSAAACMSSGKSSTFSAVPRPSSCSLPCNLHFWHDTQSITSLMLRNTPLNCDLSDTSDSGAPTSSTASFPAPISSATAENSALSSNAPNTPEHEDRMCVSSSRRSNAAVRASSAASWPSATSARASASEAFLSARSSTTKEKCRFRRRSGCSPYMRWKRFGSGLHASRPGVFRRGGFALSATCTLTLACIPDKSRYSTRSS